MSAEDNLGRQFDIYRGLQTGTVSEPLGVHWTGTADIAHDFGSGKGMGGYLHHRETYNGPYSVIHAKASPSQVENDESNLEEYNLAIDQDEDEVPIKYGAKVKVHSITKYRGDKRRTRTYNPPREMRV